MQKMKGAKKGVEEEFIKNGNGKEQSRNRKTGNRERKGKR